MKQIQPVSIWYNGQMIQATILNMTSNSDNLTNTATFYYQLLSSNQSSTDPYTQLAQGTLNMTGADYTNYSSNSNSNEFAYQWGATQLNLTLI